jgi:hypothetical protein
MYKRKFAEFIKACDHAKRSGAAIAVHNPQALGDNYEELVESLSQIAERKIGLLVTFPANTRAK